MYLVWPATTADGSTDTKRFPDATPPHVLTAAAAGGDHKLIYVPDDDPYVYDAVPASAYSETAMVANGDDYCAFNTKDFGGNFSQTLWVASFIYDDYHATNGGMLLGINTASRSFGFYDGAFALRVTSAGSIRTFSSSRTLVDGVRYTFVVSTKLDGSNNVIWQLASIAEGETAWTYETPVTMGSFTIELGGTTVLGFCALNDVGGGNRFQGTIYQVQVYTGATADLSVGVGDNTGIYQYILNSFADQTTKDPAGLETHLAASAALKVYRKDENGRAKNDGTLGDFDVAVGTWA